MDSETLFCFLCWDEKKQVLTILDTSDNIDVFYKDGILFDYALSKGNVDIFEALMNYFETKQFPIKNEIYQEKKRKLIEFLEDFASEMEHTSEMKKSLSRYIDFDDSSVDSREHDFDNDFDKIKSSHYDISSSVLDSSYQTDNVDSRELEDYNSDFYKSRFYDIRANSLDSRYKTDNNSMNTISSFSSYFDSSTNKLRIEEWLCI